MAEDIKHLLICLVASPEELGDELSELEAFVTRLNNHCVKAGVFLEVTCVGEDAQNGEPISPNADYLFAIVRKGLSAAMRHELEAALRASFASGSPHVRIYFMESGYGGIAESARSLMGRLKNEFNHYYETVGHIDSVKLKMLLAFEEDNALNGPISLSQGIACVGNEAVVDITSAPLYVKNSGLNEARMRYERLNARFAELAASYATSDDPVNTLAELGRIGAEREEILKGIRSMESELLELCKKTSSQDGSWRVQEAGRLLEEGNWDGAKRILSDPQRKQELDRALGKVDAGRALITDGENEIDIWIGEERALIATILSNASGPEAFAEAREHYERIVELVLEPAFALNRHVGILGEYAIFLHEHNDFHRSKEVTEAWVAILRKNGNTGKLARALDTLALAYHSLNRFDRAEQLYRESLEMTRKLAGDNPATWEPALASSLNNLASLLVDSSHRKEAEELYREAIGILGRLVEDNPAKWEPRFATTLNNLAELLRKDWRFEEAEPLFEKALDIRRRLAATDPTKWEPSLSHSLDRLAILFVETDRPDDAEPLFLEALGIRRRLAAKDPVRWEPSLSALMNNLAILYNASDRVDEAMLLSEEELAISRRLAEADPESWEPDLISSLNNRASIVEKNGRIEEAEDMYREALAISRRLAEADPASWGSQLIAPLNNLAAMVKARGGAEEAEGLYREALDISRQLAEAEPDSWERDLTISLYNLAIFLGKSGRFAEAEELFLEALSIQTRFAGKEPSVWLPILADTYHDLAVTVAQQPDRERDAELYLVEEERIRIIMGDGGESS